MTNPASKRTFRMIVNAPALTLSRVAAGLSVAELADASSIDGVLMADMERGHGAPTREELARVASVLSCDVASLYLSAQSDKRHAWWWQALRECELPLVDVSPRRVDWRKLESWRAGALAGAWARHMKDRGIAPYDYFSAERGELVSMATVHRLAFAMHIAPTSLLDAKSPATL